MPTINCPKCKLEISDKDKICVFCGCNINEENNKQMIKVARASLMKPIIVGICMTIFAIAYLVLIILMAKHFSIVMNISFGIMDSLFFAFAISIIIIFGKKLILINRNMKGK